MVLPMTRKSGSRLHARVAPPGPAQIVWVSSIDQEGAVEAGEAAQGVMEARVGQHDADVGECRLGQNTGDLARGKGCFEGCRVVERHHHSRLLGVHLGADAAFPWLGPAVGAEGHQRLVDAAVVAPVEDEDLVPPGEKARITQHEAVGIGCGHRHLPRRQAEAAGQLSTHPCRVGVGEHGGDSLQCLAVQGLGHLGQGVAGHRPGVAEAEVDVLDAVDIGEAGPGGGVEEERKRARPAGHPGHRHPTQQVLAGLDGQLTGTGMGVDEASLLACM